MPSDGYSRAFNENRNTDIQLWNDVPKVSWLRNVGRTRVLIIDDDYGTPERLFEGREELASEFDLWLNAEINCCASPDRFDSDQPDASLFTPDWLEGELDRLSKNNSRPYAAVFLDLHFGQRSHFAAGAQGFEFLEHVQKRSELHGVPVFIMTTVDYEPAVRDEVKKRGSVLRYIVKNAELLKTLIDAVVEYGLIADAELNAFTMPARVAAQQLRQIAIEIELFPIDAEDRVGSYPQPILLVGNTGSGRNHFARHLVKISSRRGKLDVTTRRDPWVLCGRMDSDTQHPEYIDKHTGVRLLPQAVPPDRYAAMAVLGLLHDADIPTDRYPRPPDPSDVTSRRRAVFVGDASLAAAEWQMALLDWLKYGRVTPAGATQLIPSGRCMDVWVIIASRSQHNDGLSPELKTGLHDGLSPELRLGLQKAWRVEVPDLKDRRLDVIVQATRASAKPSKPSKLGSLPEPLLHSDTSDCPPEDLLHNDALQLLLGTAATLGFRETEEVFKILRKSGFHPYRLDEVVRAFDAKDTCLT